MFEVHYDARAKCVKWSRTSSGEDDGKGKLSGDPDPSHFACVAPRKGAKPGSQLIQIGASSLS